MLKPKFNVFQVSISDNGSPILTSTTRVVVSVLDINDNSPVFDQRVYKVQVPSTTNMNESIFQVRIECLSESLSMNFHSLAIRFQKYLQN